MSKFMRLDETTSVLIPLVLVAIIGALALVTRLLAPRWRRGVALFVLLPLMVLVFLASETIAIIDRRWFDAVATLIFVVGFGLLIGRRFRAGRNNPPAAPEDSSSS